jgi:flagellar motor switch protein FliM
MSNQPVLEQAEVDALLQGMNSGAVSTEPAPVSGDVRQYDLGTEARIVRGRMPTFEMINERFARLFRTSLYNLLRRSAAVAAPAVQTFKYGDYIRRFSMPTSLNIIKVAPLRGTALLVLSPQLVFTVVDNFFGGSGRRAKIEERDFTATETRIIKMLLDAAFADFKQAWSKVLPINIEYVASEMNPQFANVASPTEIVVVTTFSIELEGGTGELELALPYAMIEPMREIFDSGAKNDRKDDDGRWRVSLREELEDAEVELTTLIGRSSVTLEQLLNLKPGDIVPCDFDGRVTVCAEHIPILRGSFGISRGQQAVKVESTLVRGRTATVAAPARTATRGMN